MTRKTTLKTVAQEAGLAVTTVSRALNDAPDISDKTKKKVRDIARHLGYYPDRAGVRLRTGRTHVISLVLSPEVDVLNQTAKMISSIANGLAGTGYHLNMTPYRQGEDMMRPIRYIVETGAADAVIFNQIEPEDPRVRYLMEHKFPFVTHGRSKWQDDHAYFDYDNAEFARAAIERLAARGRKNVLMITPMLSQRYAIDMLEGARAAAKSHGIALDAPKDINSDLSHNVIRDGVIKYIEKDPETDAILTGTTNSAMAANTAIIKTGHRTGESIDLAAKEPAPFLGLFDENIITFQEDIERAGEFLAKAAMHAANDPDAPPMQALDHP